MHSFDFDLDLKHAQRVPHHPSMMPLNLRLQPPLPVHNHPPLTLAGGARRHQLPVILRRHTAVGVARVGGGDLLEWYIKKFLGVHFVANWVSVPDGFLEEK